MVSSLVRLLCRTCLTGNTDIQVIENFLCTAVCDNLSHTLLHRVPCGLGDIELGMDRRRIILNQVALGIGLLVDQA